MPKGISTKKQGKAEKPSPAKNRLNLYLFYGHGIIWDKARNKALCRFEKGKLLTTDLRTIAILVKKRFKHKTKNPLTKTALDKAYSSFKKEIKANEKKSKKRKFDRKELNNMKISELRVLFREKKIRLLQIMTKQDMINRLLGARR